MDKILEKLFESRSRIRALRLFLMNPEMEFTMDDGAKRAGISRQQLSGEVKRLIKIGLVSTKSARMVIEKLRRSKRGKQLRPKIKIIRKRVFLANKEFLFYPELRGLVFKIAPDGRGALLSKIKRLGDIKLALISGIFTNTDAAKIDLALVGDKLKKERVSGFFRNLQLEIGKELNYAVMTTQEFNYRLNMQDRFIRDVLDYPHEKLINKLGI